MIAESPALGQINEKGYHMEIIVPYHDLSANAHVAVKGQVNRKVAVPVDKVTALEDPQSFTIKPENEKGNQKQPPENLSKPGVVKQEEGMAPYGPAYLLTISPEMPEQEGRADALQPLTGAEGLKEVEAEGTDFANITRQNHAKLEAQQTAARYHEQLTDMKQKTGLIMDVYE